MPACSSCSASTSTSANDQSRLPRTTTTLAAGAKAVTTNLQSNGSGGSGGMRRNYSANSTPYSHLEPHSNGNSAAGGFQVRWRRRWGAGDLARPAALRAPRLSRLPCPSPCPLRPLPPPPSQGFDSEGDSSNWGESDWLGNKAPAASSRPQAPAGVTKSSSTPQFSNKQPAVKDDGDDDWGKW